MKDEKQKERQAESLKAYIDLNLEGQELETARVKLILQENQHQYILKMKR